MTRRTVFGSMLGLVFLVNLARVVFAPLLRPLGAAFAASDATLGLTVTLVWLGSALLRIPTGYLLTKVSRHRVILGSGAVLVAGSVATSFADSIGGVMVGAFLMGLASGSYFIAANPLVSELFPDRVGAALGVHGTAAQAAAVAAAPFVLVSLALGDWRTTVRIVAVVATVVTVVFAGAIRRTELPAAGSGDRDLVRAARSQWRLVSVGVVTLGATGLLWNGLFNFYVKYLLTKGLPAGRANLMLTVVFATGVPAFFLTGRIVDRVPRVPFLFSVVCGFGVTVLALTAVRGLVGVTVVSATMGYVFHSIIVALDAFLLGSLPDHHRASAYAVYSGAMMGIQATGAAIVGWLVDANVPYDTVFGGLSVLPFGVGLALLVLYRAGWFATVGETG